MQAFIHQIYYNQASRQMLDSGFIPLDNSTNLRPDWYEFWVIKQFLETTPLHEGAWYGFLSPRFGQKTGLQSAQVHAALQSLQGSAANVLLLGSDWDQNAYFLNPFEQGEFWHPGLLALSQQFFDSLGWRLPLAQLVCHSHNFTFSNSVVAQPAYWRAWLALAQPFFAACEQAPHSPLAGQTHYNGSASRLAPMKTFIQERFVAALLHSPQYVCAKLEAAQRPPLNPLFAASAHAAALLQTCDLLKIEASTGPDAARPAALAAYWQVRQLLRPAGVAGGR